MFNASTFYLWVSVSPVQIHVCCVGHTVMPEGLIHPDYFTLLNTAAALLYFPATQEMLSINTVAIHKCTNNHFNLNWFMQNVLPNFWIQSTGSSLSCYFISLWSGVTTLSLKNYPHVHTPRSSCYTYPYPVYRVAGPRKYMFIYL